MRGQAEAQGPGFGADHGARALCKDTTLYLGMFGDGFLLNQNNEQQQKNNCKTNMISPGRQQPAMQHRLEPCRNPMFLQDGIGGAPAPKMADADCGKQRRTASRVISVYPIATSAQSTWNKNSIQTEKYISCIICIYSCVGYIHTSIYCTSWWLYYCWKFRYLSLQLCLFIYALVPYLVAYISTSSKSSGPTKEAARHKEKSHWKYSSKKNQSVIVQIKHVPLKTKKQQQLCFSSLHNQQDGRGPKQASVYWGYVVRI